jgi:Zn-dependent protease with chaperone function
VLVTTIEMGPLSGLEAERRRNRRWHLRVSLLWAIVLGVLVGAVLCVVSIPVGIVVGVVLAVGIFVLLRRVAPSLVAGAIKARALEPGQLPRVETLLGGLSVTVGVTTPLVAVLDDAVPNAAIISIKGAPTAVLTTGLLDALSVVELEGVLAHLLAHERLDAVERGTAGAGLSLLLGPLGRPEGRSHRLIGRERLFQADEVAALAVRYPPGLAGALKVMEQAEAPRPDSFFASSSYKTLRWLFVDPSIGRRAATDSLGDEDATAVRRRVLDEL